MNCSSFPRKSWRHGRKAASCAATLGLLLILMLGPAPGVPAAPNPVLAPARGNAADCGVMKFSGEYYIIGNMLAGDMFISRDLVHWGNRTHVFSMNNDWATGNASGDRNIHACDPSYYNGIFNLYWSVNRGDLGIVQIGHAISDKPLGPYHEPERKHWFDSKIDAHLFRDDDGSFYFYSVKFTAGNVIWGQRMLDPATLTGEPRRLLSARPRTWELLDDRVNEGPFVFKYRGQYYLVYNANHTAKGHYALGCAVADEPLNFKNAGKYPDPVVEKSYPAPGHRLTAPGQPTVVRGPNGLEYWLVYFLEVDGARRQQAIDRVFFFDRQLYIDGPTSPATPGYHPVPSQPAVLDLFDAPDGGALARHWRPASGQWSIKDKTAEQHQAEGRALATLASAPATQYLAEVNVRPLEDAGAEAGLVAYWQDSANWLLVTLDARHNAWTWRKNEKGAETTGQGPRPKGFNFQAWHSLRVAKNGTDFEVLIDDRPAPGTASPIATGFAGAGVPGLITDSARAGFDGFLYTIGWDETGAGIRNWGGAAGGTASSGKWSVTGAGLQQSAPAGLSRIFKGDPAAEYEFTAQLPRDGAPARSGASPRMGMLPVYCDEQNYLRADLDLDRSELRVSGRKAGQDLPVQTAALPRRFALPASDRAGQLWRTTTQAPATDWAAAGFDAGAWREGAGGFGDGQAPGGETRTNWKTDDLWLRRSFELDQNPMWMARLWMRQNCDAEVFINGVLALRGSGQTGNYGPREIMDAARATLHQGDNTIAIHAHKSGGSKWIDAGLYFPKLPETQGSVNLRAVKLQDRVILFANGQELLAVGGAWPASQVGLISQNRTCRFSGMTYFRLERLEAGC